MDVDSSDDGFGEINDLLNEDCSFLDGELELNFVAEKEENSKNYGFDDLASSNEFHVDMNEQGHQRPSFLPSDFRHYEISSCPQNFHSPLENGFDQDVALNETNSVCDQEKLQSPSKDNQHEDMIGELCGSYLFKSSIPDEVENVHHNSETGVSEHLKDYLSMEDANQGKEMEHSPASSAHDEILETFSETLQYELKKSEFVYEVEENVPDLQTEKLYSSPRSDWDNKETNSGVVYCSINSQAESTKLEMPHSDQQTRERTPRISKSPETERKLSVSPDTSHCTDKSPSSRKAFASPRGLQDLSNSSDLGEEVPSKYHLLCKGLQNSSSTQLSRQKSQQITGSSGKRSSSSPRSHYSHQHRRRRDRSVSLSPVRRRDSSSGYKRDRRSRSRSRSPYTRYYHRRSPRRRYSPRRRSPPSGYHSRHRSPRRRHWSPPHNRSTGVGKPGRNLYVAGFSFRTTERDLEKKFSRFGRVQEVRIVRDKRSGDSRGFGFLSLERDEEADAAIRALDKTEWNGRTVLVEKSKSKSKSH